MRALDRAEGVPDDALVPWFYTTLRNAVIDRYRRDETRNKRLEEFGRELERERDAASETDRAICACVSRLATTLKPEYAEALQRIDIAGASLKEYAAESGLTANSAGVRVHRARKALKLRLMESCGVCAEHGCVDCSCSARQGTL